MPKMLSPQERYERYVESAEVLFSCVEGFKLTGDINNTRKVNKLCGLIAEELHRVPVTPIGLISKKASKLKKKTADHYYGRKVSGELIFKMIMRGCSIKRIALLIWSRSRVIYVTSAENTRLKKFDGKNPHKSFNEAMLEYKYAKISELVKYYPNVSNNIYIIDGIEYNDSNDACTALNIDYTTLYTRCKSKSKKGKYTEWKIIKKENL
jgi:hypothetical protein